VTAAVVALAAALVLGIGALLVLSPGRPAPLRDHDGTLIEGSLSDRVTVRIGGIP
jgi:hypothetical protein